MKKILLNLSLFAFLSFIFLACSKDEDKVDPPPVAKISASSSTVIQGESISFSDISTGIVESRNWNFIGGSPSPSSSKNSSVTVTFNAAGTTTAILTVCNDGGCDEVSKTIQVLPSTKSLTLENTTHTNMTITVDGITRQVDAGQYTVFEGYETNDQISYTAFTSGKTTSGTQVGTKLTWANTVTIGSTDKTVRLVVSSEYFFIYITNNGSTLVDLYVNYGLQSESHDNIEIANDGVKRRCGYYKAWSNGNVRMYKKNNSSHYVYWNQGEHYSLPWEENQAASLSYSLKELELKMEKQVESNPSSQLPAYSAIPSSYDETVEYEKDYCK
ncbi:MAG: hypothetical protein K9H16_00870 [Bacteroidales bacterium]|nr:hypothetical protein [Bacteroidales bacterium]